MVKTYYNDNDKFICNWLEELMKDGLIGAGVVDRRPIQEIESNDLKEFTRCHFFAGVGGWEVALTRAGWGDRRVWTGSCPCQPFSVAGKQKGKSDERHVWPDWFQLINECRPPTIFGEQVSSPLGRAWLNTVRSNLETLEYAVGAADLCAASIGAPHIRQRLWFVANSQSQHNRTGKTGKRRRNEPTNSSDVSGMGNSVEQRSQGWNIGRDSSNQWTPWSPSVAYKCRDEKTRPIPVKPGLFPLVNAGSVSNRVAIVRGAGNMIVPELAATFIQAFMDTEK
jgi:DNA (cytosine-5)-methyltransferase 1